MPESTCGHGDTHEGAESNQGDSFLQQARRRKWKLSEVETHGDGLEEKAEGHVRFWFENYDGIPVDPWQRDKINHIRKVGRQLKVDSLGGVELQTNWALVRAEHRLEELLRTESAGRVAVGFNTHERITKRQQGGTCIATFGLLATYRTTTGHDPSGLGRWTSLRIEGKDGRVSRLVSAYIPCRSQKGRYTTVYAQHRRWLRKQGDSRCPRKAARDDLLSAISE